MRTPKNVAEDRRFDTAVPVRIYYTETKKKHRRSEVDGEYPANTIHIGFGRSRRSDSSPYVVVSEIIDASRK